MLANAGDHVWKFGLQQHDKNNFIRTIYRQPCIVSYCIPESWQQYAKIFTNVNLCQISILLREQ